MIQHAQKQLLRRRSIQAQVLYPESHTEPGCWQAQAAGKGEHCGQASLLPMCITSEPTWLQEQGRRAAKAGWPICGARRLQLRRSLRRGRLLPVRHRQPQLWMPMLLSDLHNRYELDAPTTGPIQQNCRHFTNRCTPALRSAQQVATAVPEPSTAAFRRLPCTAPRWSL